MKFGIFYELQLPKPWSDTDELDLVQDGARLQFQCHDQRPKPVRCPVTQTIAARGVAESE